MKNIEFHGWKVYKLNGHWNCKPLNCDYPIQSFTYVIDALIYCKENPNHNSPRQKIAKVLESLKFTREIRKLKHHPYCVDSDVWKKIHNDWEKKYLD